MSVRQGIFRARLSAAVIVCACACAMPARAHASDTEQSLLIDDNQLIYASPSRVAKAMQQVAALGVDRVKVSVVWTLIAPAADSTNRPNFDATNPAAYPAGAWARYDLIARLAAQLGIAADFQIVGPSPAWAIPHGEATNQGPQLGNAPSDGEFRQFAQAVGRRYSGNFVTTVPDNEPSLLTLPRLIVPLGPSPQPGQSDPIPRVDYWEIWNEPNERSWLNPWHRNLPGFGRQMLQPALYRGLVDAAWSGLRASGHGHDTIVFGETANVGIWDPMPFVRALYCVNRALRPLTGSAAAAVACPTSGSRSSFVSHNPALFKASGFAHHPYGFDVAPNRPFPARWFVTLLNISTLERTLTRIYGTYGQSRSGGVPLYLSEWGYKTNPPNPYVHTSEQQQAAWLDQGQFMTWSDPYVRSLAQFLLVDDKPKTAFRRGSQSYWSTYQTGLLFSNGRQKPSYDAFRIPIWLPHPRHGANVAVWGELRPADHTTLQYAVIQFRPGSSGGWNTIREVQTSSSEGFMLAHVAIPSAGQVRLAWLDPATSVVEYSRNVSVS